MKNKTIIAFIGIALASLWSCGNQNQSATSTNSELALPTVEQVQSEPHRYGGWYCPDNLNGFPAVDIANWKNVPVVNGRMASKEETQNGTSLIFVDLEKYPNAKPLPIKMPQLATFYNYSTQREDLIIVIQALNIDNDSIVGFRYLNGGNGSARLSEVNFLSDNEAEMIPAARFVSHSIQIKANQDKIWGILTNIENAEKLRTTFDANKDVKKDWRKSTNVNYFYQNTGPRTAGYGEILFGNFYIQNDYENLGYSEKFLLLENQETGITELKIVCGPFADDFETQKSILKNWGRKVKELSESE